MTKPMTWDEFGAILDEKVASGELTAEEADYEWLDFIEGPAVWPEW